MRCYFQCDTLVDDALRHVIPRVDLHAGLRTCPTQPIQSHSRCDRTTPKIEMWLSYRQPRRNLHSGLLQGLAPAMLDRRSGCGISCLSMPRAWPRCGFGLLPVRTTFEYRSLPLPQCLSLSGCYMLRTGFWMHDCSIATPSQNSIWRRGTSFIIAIGLFFSQESCWHPQHWLPFCYGYRLMLCICTSSLGAYYLDISY